MGEGEASGNAKDVTEEMEETGQIEGLQDDEEPEPQGLEGKNEKPIEMEEVGTSYFYSKYNFLCRTLVNSKNVCVTRGGLLLFRNIFQLVFLNEVLTNSYKLRRFVVPNIQKFHHSDKFMQNRQRYFIKRPTFFGISTSSFVEFDGLAFLQGDI